MTPEAQRIAIAEACPFVEWNGVCPFWRNKRGSIIRFDPLNDLNAMHEAEKVLNLAQQERYVFWLNHLHPSADIHYSEIEKDIRQEVFSLVSATAAQRAEAFLRTLNLWKD